MGQALAHEFFQVIPAKYETYCALTARIAAEAFHILQVPANLVPCQLWHATTDANHVIGFVGGTKPDMWDGHVVCMTPSLLLDGAVRGLRRDFAIDVPSTVLTAQFNAPSQALACTNIDAQRRLWWFNAPYGFDTTPPLQPVDVIDHYARALAARVSERLAEQSLPQSNAA